MSLSIVPLVMTDKGPNVPVEILAEIWDQIESEGKVEAVFYRGSINNARDWVRYLLEGENVPLIVVQEQDGHPAHPVLVTWLNGMSDGLAFGHFVPVGPYKRGSIELALQYWKTFIRPDGTRIIRGILGVTPVSYERAVKLIESSGFHVIGKIPKLCELAYEGRREDGVLSYYDLEEG